MLGCLLSLCLCGGWKAQKRLLCAVWLRVLLENISVESRLRLAAMLYTVARCKSTDNKALFAASSGDIGMAPASVLHWEMVVLMLVITHLAKYQQKYQLG